MQAILPAAPGGFHLRRMHGAFQPVPYQQQYRHAHRVGQIQINPNIQAPINIGLGSLPLSLGLFAGSGMALLLGSQAPSIRPFTTVAAVGLAGFGLINLLMPKDAPAPAPSPGPGMVTPGATSGPIAPTAETAFSGVSGRIISPGYGDTIDVPFWGTPQVPMRVRLTNPSPVDSTFDLVVASLEQPEPFGRQISNSQSQRVTIPAGETRDVDIAVGIVSWEALVDYVEVDVTVKKRRVEGGTPENLAGVMFVVE